MKTKPTNQLAVIQAVKPPPTKREIIEAMAILMIEKIRKENAEKEAVSKALTAEVETMLRAIAKEKAHTLQCNIGAGWVRAGQSEIVGVEINYDLDSKSITPELRKKLVALHAAKKSVCVPALSDAMRQVRARMEDFTEPKERINRLLTDTESRKALETALSKLK